MKPWNKHRTNSLLLKDDVGQPKQSIYTIPNNLMFGKATIYDLEGATEVAQTWIPHQPSQEMYPDRDFKKLNKMCVTNKLHRARQYSDFRKDSDARVSIKRGTTQIDINLPEENFRYGKPYSPQSPMKLILGHSYMNEAEQLMNIKYNTITQQQRKSRPNTNTKHTRASRLLSESLNRKSTPKAMYKLKEFLDVPAKTKTRFY